MNFRRSLRQQIDYRDQNVYERKNESCFFVRQLRGRSCSFDRGHQDDESGQSPR